MISITKPANISTPVMANMGIMAARGKTNAATIGTKAESTTLNHGSRVAFPVRALFLLR